MTLTGTIDEGSFRATRKPHVAAHFSAPVEIGMETIPSLISAIASRRSFVSDAYAFVGSLLGFATVAALLTGGLPLAQLGSWASAIGWDGAANWLGRAASEGFAVGSQVWSLCAYLALFGSALAVALNDSDVLFGSRVNSTLWVALSTTQQAGESAIWNLILWVIGVVVIAMVARKSFHQARAGFAHGFLALFAGLVIAPVMVLAWLVLDNTEKSEFARAEEITRAVLTAKDEHDRNKRKRDSDMLLR